MRIIPCFWHNYDPFIYYCHWTDYRKAMTLAWALWGEPSHTECNCSALSEFIQHGTY